jgi:hypothetical protein
MKDDAKRVMAEIRDLYLSIGLPGGVGHPQLEYLFVDLIQQEPSFLLRFGTKRSIFRVPPERRASRKFSSPFCGFRACRRRYGTTLLGMNRIPGVGLPFEDLHSPQNEVIEQD